MKVTVIEKVYKILRENGKMRMSEICKMLEKEHPAEGVRGIIYRHLKTAKNKLIEKVETGIYQAVENTQRLENVKRISGNVISLAQRLKSRKLKVEENNYKSVVGEYMYPSVLNEFSLFNTTSKVSVGETSSNGSSNDINRIIPFQQSNKGVSMVNITGGNSRYEREENDFYATNPETVRMFLREFHKDNRFEGTILECACGQGHMAEVLKEEYPDQEVVATDLVDRQYGQGGVNFLKYDYKRKFDAIMTNPPFKFIKEFIIRALELSNRFVVMLGRIQILEGVGRKELLQNSPLKYVYVHSQRQATWKNGSPTDPKGKPWSTAMCLAWFVWDKSYKGEPMIRWI